MLEAITMGFDETTMAYDLQRAHSADVWFLRARFFVWGTTAAILSFFIGHALATFGGINLYAEAWGGVISLWNNLF
jgi:hypothetical protein|tara:strand:- start:1639 stop:1866 length:228 start_codon:yes stop_codon:yes gene_type:complete